MKWFMFEGNEAWMPKAESEAQWMASFNQIISIRETKARNEIDWWIEVMNEGCRITSSINPIHTSFHEGNESEWI